MPVFRLVFLVAGFSLIKAQTDPSNIVCTAINSTTLQLTWDQATDPSVLGYFLHIKRVDGLRIEPDIPSVDLNSKSFDNYDFHGLGKYGTYNITIHSYTSSSNLTEYVNTCTTAEDVPNGSPMTFDCTGLSVSAISCSWNSLDLVYWNGVPAGYRMQWLSSNVSQMHEKTLASNITTTVMSGLAFGTTYMFILNPYTSVGQGTMFSTNIAATQGFPEQEEENKTRYYCNEAVPGMIEFGWEEMPCTIYAGTICALMVISGLFVCIISCQSCCGKSSSNNINLGFFAEPDDGTRKRQDDDDSEDDEDSNDNNSEMDEDMTDDGQSREFDDDYENKGYRSDEDPLSPDGRETESLDEYSKSPTDKSIIPRSRHATQADNKGLAAGKCRAIEDGRVTATDIELEAIYEEDDITHGDTYDSDYDTQSDTENTDIDEVMNVGIRSEKILNTYGKNKKDEQNIKRMKECSSSKVDNIAEKNSKTEKPQDKAKNVLKTKTLTTAAGAAGANANKINKRTNMNTLLDITPENATKQRLDIPIEPDRNTSDRTTYRKNIQFIEERKTISPFEIWGEDDDESKNSDEPKSPKHFAISKVKTDKDAHFKGNTVGIKEVKRSNDNANARNMISASMDTTDMLSATHDNEIDSWDTPVVFTEKTRTDTPVRVVGEDSAGVGHQFQSNLWDENSGWDDLNKNQKTISLAKPSIKHHGINDTHVKLHTRETVKGKKLTERDTINFNTKEEHSQVSQKTKTQTVQISNQQPQHLAEENSTKSRTEKIERPTKFFIEDELDNVTLSGETNQKPAIEQDGKMVATRAWIPQPENRNIKQGKRTPVKPIPKAQSWTAVEIEPILGSDRLGKKFPFLNVDTIEDSRVKKDGVGDIRMKKNLSDTDLPGAKTVSAQGVLSKFQKAKPNAPSDKIFYGFGTGRFRTVVAAWLAKVRFKRNPVKTVQSDWR